MYLIKVQFFCTVCWGWEIHWLSFANLPTEEELMKIFHYKYGGHHAPTMYSNASTEIFSILRTVWLENAREIDLEG